MTPTIIKNYKIMSKLKYFFFSLLSFLLVLPVKAADDYGLEATADQAGVLPNDASLTLQDHIGQIIGGLLSLVGVAFFLLTLYGGFLWMTAKGDETQSKKAQHIIFDAIIGLVIVASSYIITQFVFEAIMTA